MPGYVATDLYSLDEHWCWNTVPKVSTAGTAASINRVRVRVNDPYCWHCCIYK